MLNDLIEKYFLIVPNYVNDYCYEIRTINFYTDAHCMSNYGSYLRCRCGFYFSANAMLYIVSIHTFV